MIQRPSPWRAEALDWASRCISNGATSISTRQIAAVSTFVQDIYAAGIRDKFYRLNLFCGSSLNSVLVPLFRGPAFGGTAYGSTTDANVNFVSGDYSETGGLTGNGSTKYLNPGFKPSEVSGFATSAHISVFQKTTGTGQQLGAHWYDTVDTAQRYLYEFAASGTAYISGLFSAAPPSSTQNALFTAVRASSTSLTVYRNDSAGSTSGSAAPTIEPSLPIVIYARNFRSGSPPTDGVTPVLYGTHSLLGYSFGNQLTSGQVTSYSNAWAKLNTILGRS